MKFSTILNQILQFLPQSEFEAVIKKFKADRYVKYFKTKSLFVVHLYAQIRKKDSLRGAPGMTNSFRVKVPSRRW